jgi:hypothetical protein
VNVLYWMPYCIVISIVLQKSSLEVLNPAELLELEVSLEQVYSCCRSVLYRYTTQPRTGTAGGQSRESIQLEVSLDHIRRSALDRGHSWSMVSLTQLEISLEQVHSWRSASNWLPMKWTKLEVRLRIDETCFIFEWLFVMNEDISCGVFWWKKQE